LRFRWLTRTSSSRHIAFLAFILLSASLGLIVVLFWLVNSGPLDQLPKRTPFRKAIVKSVEALLCYRTHLVAMAFIFPITVIAHLAYYTSFYCAGESLRASTGHAASLADILSIMPLVDTIISVPISLGGVGVRETVCEALVAMESIGRTRWAISEEIRSNANPPPEFVCTFDKGLERP